MQAAVKARAVDTWPLVRRMLEEEGIARQHLNSYNEFVHRGIQSIVDEVGYFDVEAPPAPYRVRFGKVRIGRPQVLESHGAYMEVKPMEARLRNLTYASPIELEMIVEEGSQTRTTTQVIGNLPVMVKSDLCPLSQMTPEQLIEVGEDPLDPGGYFIINGSERVIVGLEDLSPNKIIVDVEKVGTTEVYKAKIYSSIIGYRSKLEIHIKPDGGLYVKAPQVPSDLPLINLIRALGIERDDEIAAAVSLKPEVQELLEVSFDKAQDVRTTREALLYIGNRIAPGMTEDVRLRKAENFLDMVLLPHIGRRPEDRRDKAYFLGEAACKLLELKLGWIEPDDKDHYGNKVVKLAGQLLADILRTAFRNLVKDMKYQLERAGTRRGVQAVAAAVRPGIITEKLANAIATGNWGRGRVGVTQLLDRTNYLSALSHLRRVQSPLSRSQPNFEARELHPTQFGRICPVETPEGANVGLVKNLALSAVISVTAPTEQILDILGQLGVRPPDLAGPELKERGCRVFVEGRLAGYVADGARLASQLRQYRREGFIRYDVGIAYYQPKSEKGTPRLYINAGAGRVLRPLVVVQDGVPLLRQEHVDRVEKGRMSWRELVALGVIELIDADEEENCVVAMRWEDVGPHHTHLELYPPFMLGVTASLIPFAEHNQSPRNTYEAAMAKQSIGLPYANYAFTPHVRQHLLVYPQVPLTTTKMASLLHLGRRPIGQNCVVAVLSYEAYNIEDAIVVSKGAVDRGWGRSVFYRLYEAEAKQYLGGMKDTFEIPDPRGNVRGYKGERFYRLLEQDGAVMVEAEVAGNDVLIGRTSPPRFMAEYREFEVRGPYRRDTSVAMRPSEMGVVDTVFITETAEGNKLYKVRVRHTRPPEIGDKFASRHGQKGVIGLIVPPEDLPYTADGIVPDIIISSHAFPSRMTVGQFLESLTGKAAALAARPLDGTPFEGVSEEELARILESYGFKRSGKEVMYDPRTGKPLKAEVFIGVIYYQKLHHMVADKIHARARGQVQMLTKQPTEGRSRGGGLRFGEMERDCIISYGASMVLKDRLLDESDKTQVQICEGCGLLAYYDGRTRRYVCRLCGDEARVSTVEVAYAFKLLLQEMMALAIAPRVALQERV
jgi:DNA-directed RNA polymerase subunit B